MLYKDLLSISPFSYCGVDGKKGYMRITCCSPQDELREMMDRIEKRILKVRLEKNKKMRHEIEQLLHSYENIETTFSRSSLLAEPSSRDRWAEQSPKNEPSLSSSQEEERSSIEEFAREIRIRYQNISREKEPSARGVKKANQQLENILSELRPAIMRATRLGQRIAARKIKNFLSHNFLASKNVKDKKTSSAKKMQSGRELSIKCLIKIAHKKKAFSALHVKNEWTMPNIQRHSISYKLMTAFPSALAHNNL